MSKRLTLAALAALPIAFTTMGAQAQWAQYCDNRLTAETFYATVRSEGSRSMTSYFVTLRNRSGETIRYAVRFTAPHIMAAQSGGTVANLASLEQVTVTLGMQSFNNPSGAGQLSQADMIRYTQVFCR